MRIRTWRLPCRSRPRSSGALWCGRACETLTVKWARCSHAQVNISFHNKQLDLVEKLISITPKGLDRIFFWNGGADAVEAAWKLARHATGKRRSLVVTVRG